MAIAPDGAWLATTSDDKTARIWAVPDQRTVAMCRRTSERAPPRTEECAPFPVRGRGGGGESAAVGSGWQGGG
ncbi:hypothetical protein ACWGJT_34670 [Streptomyces xantholiticus]